MQEYFDYWLRYHDKFMARAWEHVTICALTIVISLVLAAVLTLLIYRSQKLTRYAILLFSAIYSIPSLALFAILIPITGLGMKSALIVLVLYNQYLLLQAIHAGLLQVNPDVLEAAAAMGMPEGQIFWKVRLPLAMPVIMTGIRLAVISTIGIASIAAVINAGGLGAILFDGLRTMNQYKIVIGTILCVLIALSAAFVLRMIEQAVSARAQGKRPAGRLLETLRSLFGRTPSAELKAE